MLEVNQLLKQFQMMRKTMGQLGKMTSMMGSGMEDLFSPGAAGNLGAGLDGAGMLGLPGTGVSSRDTKPKKKNRKDKRALQHKKGKKKKKRKKRKR